MSAAAFTATFADWKLVKTRGVVQVVLEIPLEKSDEAYQVVGGMPDPAKERWFAVARLQERAEAPSGKATTTRQSKEPASWHDMQPAQQAGILCNEKSFHKFLQGYCAKDWRDFSHMSDGVQTAAFCIRRLCNGITSRRELIPGTPAAEKWRELVSYYRAWMREAEVV